MKKTNRAAKIDTRVSPWTPAEQAEIAAAEQARIEMMYANTARFFLACEHNDAEGEAY